MALMDYELEVDFAKQMKRDLMSVLYLGADIPLEAIEGKSGAGGAICSIPLPDDMDPDIA